MDQTNEAARMIPMHQDPARDTFLNTLTWEVFARSLGDLRQGIMDYAASLDPSEREGFAAAFSRPGVSVQQAGAARPDATGLLEEIAELRERLEQGEYFEGFGWDDDLCGERSFGDESWVWELSALFAAADGLFAAGDLPQAREAYERLFAILERDEEVGIFSGSLPAAEMLEGDLSPSQLHYLRCVYELAPEDERPAKLAAAWFALADHDDALTLVGIDSCREEGLTGLEAFLPGWIAILRARLAERPHAPVRTLLVEATLFSRGVEALGELARSTPVAQAELYRDWVVTLQAIGQVGGAEAAAREALEVLVEPGSTKADIADMLAAGSGTDGNQRLSARRDAFRASPNLRRLAGLHAEESAHADPLPSMQNEADFFHPGNQTLRLPSATRMALLILADRVEEAIAHAEAGSGAGGFDESVQWILLPFLLLSGLAHPGIPPRRGRLLERMASGFDHAESLDLEWRYRADWQAAPGLVPAGGGDEASMSAILLLRLGAEELTATQRTERLDAAQRLIERIVGQIVSGKHRGQYRKAADLVTSRLEVGYLNSDAATAEDFAATLAARFPRHRAFQQELAISRKDSTVLQS